MTSQASSTDDHDHTQGAEQPGIAGWLLLAVAFPLAAFEAISVHSTLGGAPAGGAVGGLLVFAAVACAVAVVLVPEVTRHRVLSQAAVVVSAMALICVVALGGKIAAARGISADGGTVVRAALLFAFQLGWALTYWISVTQEQKSQSRFIPAAVGGVLLIVGGLMSGDAQPTPPAASEKFVNYPKANDMAFARETERVGDDERGTEFAHYHTGHRPLLGIAFSTRDWMRRECIDSDLRGIFDREGPADGEHVLLARPGYAVGAVETRSSDHINAIRVRFGLIEGASVSLDDTYWSEWVGNKKLSDDRTEIESYSKLVLGLSGRQGMVLNSLSLLVAK